MAGFSSSVTVPRPPAEVFPWLFEADKVPQWTGNLESYEVQGALGKGTRIKQRLKISGESIGFEMEITRYDPPSAADARFAISGVEVTTTYALAQEGGGGTRLTQTIEGHASGFKARMLLPIVQPRLERKLSEDLERLRGILSAG